MTVSGRIPAGAPVLLDMDGTLVHSEHVHRRAWGRFFDASGVTVDDDTYRRVYMGRRAADVLAEVDGPWQATGVPAAVASLAEQSRTLATEVVVVDGAPELLAALRAHHHRLAVVTSAGREWARRVLADAVGLGGALDALVTAEDVAVGKPDPEGYLTACARLTVDPAECVAFEDSPSGVAALVAAGVEMIVGVTTTATPAVLRAAGARTTVPDLRPDRLLGRAG